MLWADLQHLLVVLEGEVRTFQSVRVHLSQHEMDVAYVQAGGGIVADSTPAGEYEETRHKAAALLQAIDKAEGRG